MLHIHRFQFRSGNMSLYLPLCRLTDAHLFCTAHRLAPRGHIHMIAHDGVVPYGSLSQCLPETTSPVLTPMRICISANSGRLVAHTARRAPVSTAWSSTTRSFVTTRLTELSLHRRCRAHCGSAWCQWALACSSISSGAIRGCPAVAPDVAVPL